MFIYVYMYRGYTEEGTHACVRICMWRPEVDKGILPSLFLCLTEAESLNQTRAH